MTNNQQSNKTSAGTNAAKAKQQNTASASNKFGTEFASETDVQAVKQQNAQAEAKKNQQAGQ
ncbi:gamma-type small acid-soluble spore protein [Priestia megaterium]|uniref:gamma-type small acid-soluble spore protein n=1 Tax=Priestia megaterium TaxID=1404 RepID=UPI0023513E3A|nr:gamma-type small acid-soluble spore protein [Priestia megaterium]